MNFKKYFIIFLKIMFNNFVLNKNSKKLFFINLIKNIMKNKIIEKYVKYIICYCYYSNIKLKNDTK